MRCGAKMWGEVLGRGVGCGVDMMYEGVVWRCCIR